MIKRSNKVKSFTALAVLLGTIIGAGILGIPYVVMKSGFAIGAVHIVLIGILMTIIMLYLGEIVLRTKSTHQLPGYAEKYLGHKGKVMMLLATIFGVFSAIVAYLIAEGRSLSYLFFNSPNYEFQMGIIFLFALSAITFFGIKALEEGEILGVLFVFLTIISIAVYFANKINIDNLKYLSLNNFFAPFGVILFAFLGFVAIPEIKRVLGERKQLMKSTIIGAHVIVIIIYLIFAAVVLGFKGSSTPEIATIALGKPFILLGIITMFTAYLSISTAMIDTLRFDFKKSKKLAWFYTVLIPLLLFIILSIAKQTAFTTILGIGGVLSGGFTAILILSMIKQAKKHGNAKPPYSMPYSKILNVILIAIFAAGAILEIINIIK